MRKKKQKQMLVSYSMASNNNAVKNIGWEIESKNGASIDYNMGYIMGYNMG